MLVRFLAIALALAAPACSSNAFRKPHVDVVYGSDAVKADLMLALHQSLALAQSRGQGSLTDIGRKLVSTYNALPKNDQGLLEQEGVRYLCHSYFLKEHGWLIRGLEPQRAHRFYAVRDDSITDMKADQVPEFVQAVLGGGFRGRAFQLSDVVAMVAVLRNLILNEGVQILSAAYDLNGFADSETLSEEDLFRVLESYMTVSILEGKTLRNVTQHQIDKNIFQGLESYDNTRMFMQDTMQNDMFLTAVGTNPFKERLFQWTDASAVMMTMSRQQGKIRDLECQTLKDGLVQLDKFGSGRVPMKSFYQKGKLGDWDLQESVEYLREVGALDESLQSRGPQLIISNYITGVSNCDSPSDYYSVCCIHECEDLLNHIEVSVHAPTARPDTILQIVGNLSSMSVEAPRNLSIVLVKALGQISEVHNGLIPLHSRLFAQWMHYAFPYECPYPHASSAFNPLTPSEWFSQNGRSHISSPEERAKYDQSAQASEASGNTDGAYMSQWTLEEEMLAGGTRASPPSFKQSSFSSGSLGFLFKVVAILAGISTLVSKWQTLSDSVMMNKRSKKKLDLPS